MKWQITMSVGVGTSAPQTRLLAPLDLARQQERQTFREELGMVVVDLLREIQERTREMGLLTVICHPCPPSPAAATPPPEGPVA